MRAFVCSFVRSFVLYLMRLREHAIKKSGVDAISRDSFEKDVSRHSRRIEEMRTIQQVVMERLATLESSSDCCKGGDIRGAAVLGPIGCLGDGRLALLLF